MINVYWSPWQQSAEAYNERKFSYIDPEWLTEEISKCVNRENKVDNFFKCPGVIEHLKNTLILRSTSDIHMKIEHNRISSMISDEKSRSPQLFKVKQPSLLNSHTINYSCNWIFFADKPVTVTTSGAFMHKTSHTECGYYVPGTYDISKWFRPIEFAFQMWPDVNEFKAQEGEPLLYAKFNTDEPVKLHRFNLTDDINAYANNCMRMKGFSKIKSLNKLYDVFLRNKTNKLLLEEIKKNVV